MFRFLCSPEECNVLKNSHSSVKVLKNVKKNETAINVMLKVVKCFLQSNYFLKRNDYLSVTNVPKTPPTSILYDTITPICVPLNKPQSNNDQLNDESCFRLQKHSHYKTPKVAQQAQQTVNQFRCKSFFVVLEENYGRGA